MRNVYHLFCKLCHFPSLESLEIQKFFGRDAVGIVHIPLIDDIFRTELIPCLFFKLLKDIRTYRCGVPVPVHILLPCELVEDQGELMEKRSVTDHVDMRIIRNKLSQPLHRIFVCLRLTYVKSDLFFKIFPAICHCIVHMYRIPHNIGKETDCIIMKCLRAVDRNISRHTVITPHLR